MPEEYEEFKGLDDDDDDENRANVPRNELIYLAGRIYLDSDSKWVYEQFNHVVESEKIPKIAERLA